MTTYIFRLPTAEPAIHQDLLALMTHKEFQRMSSVLYNMRRTITFVLFFFSAESDRSEHGSRVYVDC